MDTLVDFTIPGTPLPKIPIGTLYRVTSWPDYHPDSKITNGLDCLISYGSKLKNEKEYILCEKINYSHTSYFMIDLNDVIRIWEDSNKPKMKTRKIMPHQAQSIIDLACSDWKNKLASLWSVNIVLNAEFEIDESFYEEMRNACTDKQHKLFDTIFGPDIQHPKDGTPCLVSADNGWILRYANGKGKFYCNGRKEGMTTNWKKWVVLDMNNLPVVKQWKC